jgi:hypothetical protein
MEEFEDIKGAIRIRKSMGKQQHGRKKIDNRTNNDQQNKQKKQKIE